MEVEEEDAVAALFTAEVEDRKKEFC